MVLVHPEGLPFCLLTCVLVSTYVCKDARSLPVPSSPHPRTLEEDKRKGGLGFPETGPS